MSIRRADNSPFITSLDSKSIVACCLVLFSYCCHYNVDFVIEEYTTLGYIFDYKMFHQEASIESFKTM